MITKLGNLAPGMCFDPLNPYRVQQRGRVLAVNASEVKVEVVDPEEGKKSRHTQGWSPGALVKIVPESEFFGARSGRHPYNVGSKMVEDPVPDDDEGEEEMTATATAAPVTKELAVKALREICQSPDLNPKTMPLKAVQAKLNALNKVPREELHEPEDPVLKDILKDALSEAGVKVVEDEGAEAESNGEASEEKPPRKKPKAKKKPKAESNGEAHEDKPKKKDDHPKERKERKPREGITLIGAAIRVLREAHNKPLSPKNLVERAVEKGYWPGEVTKESIASLASPIYHEIKHKGDKSRFRKPEKGLVALTEIGKGK